MKKQTTAMMEISAIRARTMQSIKDAKTTRKLQNAVRKAFTQLDDIILTAREQRPQNGQTIAILDAALTLKLAIRYKASEKAWALFNKPMSFPPLLPKEGGKAYEQNG